MGRTFSVAAAAAATDADAAAHAADADADAAVALSKLKLVLHGKWNFTCPLYSVQQYCRTVLGAMTITVCHAPFSGICKFRGVVYLVYELMACS